MGSSPTEQKVNHQVSDSCRVSSAAERLFHKQCHAWVRVPCPVPVNITTSRVYCLPMQADDFLGLTKKGAQNKAEEKNLIFRLIRIDAEQFYTYPDDERTDRLCVEIDDGKVTKATIR